ncbi:MAG: hypothetical protein Q9221_003711 [Calogaya cf. arnoldii]
MPGPPSAIVGQPPLTADDTLIVHGWQVLMGMGKKDPSLGLTIAKKPPPPGQSRAGDTVNIAVACSISMALMILFTGTRLVIRRTNKALVWGMDDWTIILALLCALTLPAIYCYKLAFAGAGKHVYDVTYWELANHQTMASPALALFFVAVSVIKISIVCFYMRLSAFASRAWMWTHRTFIAALIIGAIVSTAITMAQCNPYYSDIRNIGRQNVKPKCVDLKQMGIGFMTWHILSDSFLCAVPFIMLWRVQMKFWTKFKVCIAGIIGLVNVALSIARQFATSRAKGPGSFDVTYTATFSFAYSISELTLGIMTANLPVLSIIATKTVELVSSKLSWTTVSSDGSPDRSSGRGRPRSYKRKHDESETEFGRLRAGGKPTIRHDVEYIYSEDVEAQPTRSNDSNVSGKFG